MVLYRDFTMLCGARLVREAVDGLIEPESAPPSDTGERDRNDRRILVSHSVADAVNDYRGLTGAADYLLT